MGMTGYEYARLSMEPFLPPLYRRIRREIGKKLAGSGGTARILDVGGRKSPYTIGVDAKITIIDLPRESEVQKGLNLGIDPAVMEQTVSRRSNVLEMLVGDMTDSGLPGEAYDHVVAVEVLEHVEADDRFVSEVARVLRPGGAFIMSTPNGDWVENRNPDHKRHYRRTELESLLTRHFGEVSVEYAIVGGRYRSMGLRPWSLRHPVTTAGSALGNIVNTFQSSGRRIRERAAGTHHLIAVATKVPVNENDQSVKDNGRLVCAE